MGGGHGVDPQLEGGITSQLICGHLTIPQGVLGIVFEERDVWVLLLGLRVGDNG